MVRVSTSIFENDEIEKAIECFDNTWEDGYQLVGEYFFENEDYYKAKKYFEKGIYTQDEDWIKLAKKFIEKNDENAAYDCFYYTISPEYYIVEHLLSKDDEIEDNEKICYYLKNIFFEFIDKNSVDHIFSLYLEKSKNIQDDKFIEDFEELIEYLVDNTSFKNIKSHLYFILSKFYLNKKNNNKTKKFLDKCEQLGYKDCDFYLQIAHFYIELDFYKGKQYFIKFIKLFKEKENSQDMQKYFDEEIFISLLLKEYDITKKYLELAIKDNSGDIYNALNEFTNNNYDKCIDILENIQEKNNNILYSLKDLILAKCYYKELKLGQARQILEESLKTDKKDNYLNEILNLQIHITLANIYNEQKEDNNSEKQCLKALRIDYTNQEVFDILLSLYEKDTNLFIESNIIDIINNIIKNNREYNKTVFCHLLKNFILDFKKNIITKQKTNKKLENLRDKFYLLFDIYFEIDHKNIY